jgi:hypothetical protein
VERPASVAVNKQINQIFILSSEALIPQVKLIKISTFAKRLVPWGKCSKAKCSKIDNPQSTDFNAAIWCFFSNLPIVNMQKLFDETRNYVYNGDHDSYLLLPK